MKYFIIVVSVLYLVIETAVESNDYVLTEILAK